MAISLTNAQHQKLDVFLEKCLDLHVSGKLDKKVAVLALAHVFTAGLIDNESEVLAWIEDPDESWARAQEIIK